MDEEMSYSTKNLTVPHRWRCGGCGQMVPKLERPVDEWNGYRRGCILRAEKLRGTEPLVVFVLPDGATLEDIFTPPAYQD